MSEEKKHALGEDLVALSAAFFAGVFAYSWTGRLGLKALLLLIVAVTCFFAGRKRLAAEPRRKVSRWAKVFFTIVGIVALLRHPIAVPLMDANGNPIPGSNGGVEPIYSALVSFVGNVDGSTFLLFALIAMVIKFIGVICSAFAWHLLLVGQGIRFPFWQKIMTSFLIGRFIGTFMPSTIGLDGYTLYEAGRYSNKWPRAITAKVLEKFIGVTGLFLGMVLTLPFGYSVLQDVCTKLDKPEAAPVLAGAILAVAGGISLVVIVGLAWPVLLTGSMRLFGKIMPGRIRKEINKFADAAGAYRGQVRLLFLVLFNKFITHFTTAMVYFFTALAIGVVGAAFWPIVFGSTIQIFATLFSPTIAGEGAREAFQ
ncbi:MAG: lysylphosphatidylglycerol synthase transmembrane domain-containing protein, partial [Myxococcota bacterium]|nr:lysylphosphatidylglycerol synthase transmembrane domain-containing protein [Myxococcota bacterium]